MRSGDIAKAAALAPEVQKAQDEVDAKGLRFTNKRANIYNINDALGRAAFLRKDYLAAGDYLLKAADTPPGDPALSSFGPDVWLARALLQAGYKDVVVTFFERCKSFWPKPQLDQWIAAINNGETPDFKMNIFSKEPEPSH